MGIIEEAKNNINFTELYQKLRQSIDNFNANKTIQTELAMLEAEKNYNVASIRWYGYEAILKESDPGDVKSKISELEEEFNKIRRGISVEKELY